MIATATPESLRKIVANVRERFPVAAIVGVVADSSVAGAADWFDSSIRANWPLAGAYFRLLPLCLGKRRFQKIILPFTDEGHAVLKWITWLLPFWRMEAYNENLDSFNARSVVSLNGHYWWRMRQRRLLRRQRREIRLAEREARHRALPVGVVGSASAYYLKTIVPVVRTNFPQAQIHGLLPKTLESAARSLSDSRDHPQTWFGNTWASLEVFPDEGPMLDRALHRRAVHCHEISGVFVPIRSAAGL